MSDPGGVISGFTTQSTATLALLNWPTCLWVGMPNATRLENRGFEENVRQKMLPGDPLVGEQL